MSSMRLLWLLCGLISALVSGPASIGFAAETEASAIVDLSVYDGHWLRIEADESDAERKIAIQKAVKGLSWIVRRMAGGVLRRSTTPPHELRFDWDGERLYQALTDKSGGFSRLIELGGEFRTRKDSRGVDFASAWAWTDHGLRLRWEQHQATGNNIYRVDEDSETLIIEHTIIVTAISNIEPIVFFSRFSRTPLPARDARSEANPIDRPSSD